MHPHPSDSEVHASQSETVLRRVLGGMSIFTVLMTIPQVWTIWIRHQAAGVSLFTWSAYLLSAVLWFWFGIQKKDKNIYLPVHWLDHAGSRCDCGSYHLWMKWFGDAAVESTRT
jgi:uncharacterized protein with PQ loop repeat